MAGRWRPPGESAGQRIGEYRSADLERDRNWRRARPEVGVPRAPVREIAPMMGSAWTRNHEPVGPHPVPDGSVENEVRNVAARFEVDCVRTKWLPVQLQT